MNKKHSYENDICKAFVIELDYRIKIKPLYKDLFYYHIPNGGYRNIREARVFKLLGVRAGVSDYFIMRANSKYHGLYLEFKFAGNHLTKYKNKLTESQASFFEIAENEHYKTAMVTSSADALKILDDYLK